ncbi:protein kinase [Hamiltosporidium magnivora]|uniref:Protein kinase n=1 Tax=Hamiltosporidium magnivora TaxID=148818 RepID=A0A4Q9LL71_9MICR|nr:protein kinase [Hamiltosporidium magnivora]
MENYRFLEKIGRGTHGTVYLLESEGYKNKYVVCKSVGFKHKKYAIKEINILSKLSHKRIIKLLDAIIKEPYVFIILEYSNYGNLSTFIRFYKQSECNIPYDLIWSAFAQITDGLNFLHKNNIIHRDIKPSNILVNQNFLNNEEIIEFKICDFSLSTKLLTDEFFFDESLVGTPYYMAPEIIKRIKYNSSVDVWSLGVCMYEMICFKKPFISNTRKELLELILDKPITFIPNCSDKKLQSLILECLQKNNRIKSYSLLSDEKIKYFLTLVDLKLKELKICSLEKKIKEMEERRIRDTQSVK